MLMIMSWMTYVLMSHSWSFVLLPSRSCYYAALVDWEAKTVPRFGKDGEKSQDSMKSIPVVCQGGSSCTQRHVIAGRLRS
jgi:hypothetical protein